MVAVVQLGNSTGTWRLVRTEGKVNGAKYREIIDKNLLPRGQKTRNQYTGLLSVYQRTRFSVLPGHVDVADRNRKSVYQKSTFVLNYGDIIRYTFRSVGMSKYKTQKAVMVAHALCYDSLCDCYCIVLSHYWR